MKDFVPYIMIASLVVVYMLAYLLNKKTPIPEECKIELDEETCTACHNFSCTHHGDVE